MIFVCASSSGDTAAVATMASARRSARDAEVIPLKCGPVAIAAAGCAVRQARAGKAEACLLRPPRGVPAVAEHALEAVTAHWASHGVLPDLPFDGAFVLLVAGEAGSPVAVATDRFGIVRLYFHEADGRMLLSSDMHGLCAALDRHPDLEPQAIYDYVFFHGIPGPRTIYRGVSKTGPAAALTWSQGHLAISRHWEPEFATGSNDGAPVSADLLAALEAAVARRTDNTCGAFLSGGLDSSSVAGMLSRAVDPAHTFTIGFDAAGYDESAYARIAAEHFATEHHEYFVTPADVCAVLPDIAAHYGEPFGNSSVIPAYCCARFAREQGIDLMLAGDGGDELFAGNTRYVDQDVFEAWYRVPAPLRALIEAGYRTLPFLARLPLASKGASYLRRARMGLPDRLQSYNFLNEIDPLTVFDRDWLTQVDREEPWRIWRARFAEPATASTLQRMLYLDWKFTLTDNDLVKVSQMCDLAGVEVAYPMLDNAVVDLSCRLTDRDLLRGGQLRGWYKAAMANFLPQTIIDKSKHGFGLPFGVWMREDAKLQELAGDALATLERRGIFATGFPAQALAMHRSGTAGYYGELVWVLTALSMWLEGHMPS